MSIVITATGISAPDGYVTSTDHAARAGLACLSEAELTVEDVDFLVNTGVYRHHNLCEPSACALIQHEMGMCLDVRKYPVRKNVFSFDLNNGACGVLSAVTALGAMMQVRGKQHALLVTSDCPPSGAPDPSFPITAMGSAVLLSHSDEPGRGFSEVWHRNSKAAVDGQRGSCDLTRHGTKSRGTIDVVRSAAYLEQLQRFAQHVVTDYLDAHAVDRAGLSLVCSQPSATFASELADGVGIAADRVIGPGLGDVHTSALPVGVRHAFDNGLATEGSRVLLVNAGGGLTVGCALYTA